MFQLCNNVAIYSNVTICIIILQYDRIREYTESVERQKGISTSPLFKQLYPFVSKLTIYPIQENTKNVAMQQSDLSVLPFMYVVFVLHCVTLCYIVLHCVTLCPAFTDICILECRHSYFPASWLDNAKYHVTLRNNSNNNNLFYFKCKQFYHNPWHKIITDTRLKVQMTRKK